MRDEAGRSTVARSAWIWLLAGLISASTSGCLLRSATYFARDTTIPLQAWEVRVDPNVRQECLLVFLPGLFDLPDQIFEEGLVRETRRATDHCDIIAVDSHMGYFMRGDIRERLASDVLTVAEARGYRDIWLVGISMGALGALMVARENPDRIRGLVLLSPWLGDERVVRAVRESGGLRRWEPPADLEERSGMEGNTGRALAWLAGYADGDDARPALYLGAASNGRYHAMSALVAEVVPPARRFSVDGAHDWASWRVLWARVLEEAPWERARPAGEREP